LITGAADDDPSAIGTYAVAGAKLGPQFDALLVVSGVVQGFSTPPLMLLIMRLTSRRDIMGERANGIAINVLGWLTTAVIFAATLALVISWTL
jgi:Mn2+/Fe2+ NRAMP family transporter